MRRLANAENARAPVPIPQVQPRPDLSPDHPRSTPLLQPNRIVQVRGAQRRAYAENAFDFVAIYIIPEDIWYIVPEARTRGHSALFLRPRLRSKFGRYKEAWHLLRGKPVAEKIIEHIEACAEIPLPMETAMAF
ncbi:MAG: hypothetical protein LAO03_10310 [Acidobacteriia bacterium]|nr:hypothetical protein [Terriglobia bacterium]